MFKILTILTRSSKNNWRRSLLKLINCNDLAGFESSTYFSITKRKTGEDVNNPYYNNRIKNIMIFQAGGWSGLLTDEDANTRQPTWPLRWGKKGYLVKNNNVYLHQLEEMRQLSGNLAISVLLMPDAEAKASGYGAYFDGKWKTPNELYASVKWAAWMKGIMTCPHDWFIFLSWFSNPNLRPPAPKAEYTPLYPLKIALLMYFIGV